MSDSSFESMTSNKPYLVRAYYEWLSDNDLTPYIAVDVNIVGVLVPMNYVVDGQIVLNVALSAVGTIDLSGDSIQLSARFAGKVEHITVPYAAISAIYAKENGVGTSLPIEHVDESLLDDEFNSSTSNKKPQLSSVKSGASTSKKVDSTDEKADTDKVKTLKPKTKPSLKIIK
jgi:stringent starvation protein B